MLVGETWCHTENTFYCYIFSLLPFSFFLSLHLASETHQQTHSKQSINSMTTTGGKKKNRAKLKRKKVALGSDTAASEGDPSQTEKEEKQSGSNLLYSVINTFRRPRVEEQGSGSTSTSRKSSSRGNSSNGNGDQLNQSSSAASKEGDLELEDDYEESEDDYPHYGSNSASSLLISLSSLLLIIGALGHC